ncbi:hypothetical protein, partial [Stutzerimonas stutzeri]|uniref:hypothetical protein n=1 Tax=Stutzerimonas stutzeri TaxID=316 RepID=UPI002108F00B
TRNAPCQAHDKKLDTSSRKGGPWSHLMGRQWAKREVVAQQWLALPSSVISFCGLFSGSLQTACVSVHGWNLDPARPEGVAAAGLALRARAEKLPRREWIMPIAECPPTAAKQMNFRPDQCR